jgi:penicillin amidase
MADLLDIVTPVVKWIITSLSRRNLPQTQGRIKVEGIIRPVEIMRDSWGIPHIYAENTQDLFFAQGYVHAQDRLWQMELNRRTAKGCLSEIFGAIALDTDRAVRTFGFHRLAKGDWDLFDDFTQDTIRSYTAGVNSFIARNQSKLPVEFTLIRHKPEPWDPIDSLSFMRIMMWQLSHAWYSEIVRSQIIKATGPELAAELEINYPSSNPSSLPEGIEFNLMDAEGQLSKADGPFINRGIGSNAWVVSGEKSTTGKPYLCNDMHLAISVPGLWYQSHLKAGDYHVAGVSIPGIPGVLVGHNAHVAWGMTLAFTDCEDLFIERFDPDAPNKYLTEDGWQDAEIVQEKIIIKGENEPHIEQVMVTRHGPVISDIVGHEQEKLAVNSMALRPSTAYRGWLVLNKSTNWDDFVDAMHYIDAPQLNVVYADTDGNIGYWITGTVPIRRNGTGEIPVPGWTGEYEWIDTIPFDKMPHALNPASGYIVTCNNCVTTTDYPYFLGNTWMNGYRARRISDVLESKESFSANDFRNLQLDFTCLPGLELASLIRSLNFQDPEIQGAFESFIKWDGQLVTETIGGTIYEVLRYTLVRNLLLPTLGEELCNKMMGEGFHPLLLSTSEFYGQDTVALLRLLKDPNSWWVKNAGGFQLVVEESLKQTVHWLRDELGPDMNSWQWGNIHRVTFAHALSLQKPLDIVFNLGPFPIGGDTDTTCQTAMLPNEPYDNQAWSPSFRQIIDMGNLSQSLAAIPPGQSGQLGSKHYDNLIEPWLAGEYFPVLWTRDQITKASKSTLVLE